MDHTLTQKPVTPGDDALETAIQHRLDDINSEQYRKNTASVLRRFAAWSRKHNGVSTPEELTTQHIREYARELGRGVEDSDREFSPETARRYFAYVHAWLEWCIEEELLSKNPAKPSRAKKPLPDDETETERQYWSDRDRKAIIATAAARVDAAGERDDIDRRAAYRDQALVALLAYSGVRGAEILSVSNDDDRNGIQWRHIDLQGGTIDLFGKNRERDIAPILDGGLQPLRRWKRFIDPDPNDAVFPRLDNAGQAMDPTPSITTQAARDILTDLCEWSDYEFNEDLKPHGARRGLGRELYREAPALTQEVLRHKSIETTKESYAEEETKRVREDANEILNE